MVKINTLLTLSLVVLLGAVEPVQAAGGWLGFQPEQPVGVQVGDIIKDSPADKCGLQRGDVILQLNGQNVQNISQFSMEIYRLDPGAEITLSVHRKGEIKEIKTKLDNVAGHAYAMPGAGHPHVMMHPSSAVGFNRFPWSSRSMGTGSMGTGSMGTGSIGVAHTHDYQTRLKSAWSMLDAYERIAAEKQLGEKGQQVGAEIRNLLDQAQQSFDKYKINEGVSLMDRAYAKVQNELIQMRAGETLIQTKSFATPENEYVYEIGRNNVFQTLLEQAINSQGVAPENVQRIEEARSLRSKAAESALQKEFKQGIAQLEQSSDILIELLRKAGLDIP